MSNQLEQDQERWEQDKRMTKQDAALPPVRSEPLLALPDDVRIFIRDVTLHLQASRSKTPEQHDAMFKSGYRLYAKYDVEQRSANSAICVNAKVGRKGS